MPTRAPAASTSPNRLVRDAEVDRAKRQGRRLRPAPELAGFLRQDADPGYLHLVPPHPVVLEARAYDCTVGAAEISRAFAAVTPLPAITGSRVPARIAATSSAGTKSPVRFPVAMATSAS